MNTSNKHTITVCYFGIYHSDYCRNRILIKGLRSSGIKVIECSSNLSGLRKYFDLVRKHRKLKGSYNVMVVGYPAQQAMILARLLTRRPIIFDAFVPFYDSEVYARGAARPISPRALYCFIVEWLAFRFADRVIVDTYEHQAYFSKMFSVRPALFRRIFVGSDEDIFIKQELKKEHTHFTVHFHGVFNPLQGIEYIVRAAKLLIPDGIQFNLIGRGQQSDFIAKLVTELEATNVNLLGYVPHSELKTYLAQADVCLGVFSTIKQAQRAIPIKAFESISSRLPLITSATPASQELFSDRENVLFCTSADEQSLAAKIRELKNDSALRARIAEGGYRLFRSRLTPEILGREFAELINQLESDV